MAKISKPYVCVHDEKLSFPDAAGCEIYISRGNQGKEEYLQCRDCSGPVFREPGESRPAAEPAQAPIICGRCKKPVPHEEKPDGTLYRVCYPCREKSAAAAKRRTQEKIVAPRTLAQEPASVAPPMKAKAEANTAPRCQVCGASAEEGNNLTLSLSTSGGSIYHHFSMCGGQKCSALASKASMHFLEVIFSNTANIGERK
ncbi:MAG: hypothetical protein LBJ14_10295 [Desulfarculales bacterium]|jgi:uncharacterized CHY-type Zn-finger protein|nr:hypothetical protein [Desulfarculales bacterium]